MDKPICVLGVLDTPKGNQIAREMMTWLKPVYDLHIVGHDGSQFEYPALKVARELSITNDVPVLYLHTRGAVNTYPTTIPTRRCWRDEFGNKWEKYFTLADTDKPRVVCPFVDYDRETRYNGFVANKAAWQLIDLKPNRDRFVFERLWVDTDCEVVGTIVQSDKRDIKKIRRYLAVNYGR